MSTQGFAVSPQQLRIWRAWAGAAHPRQAIELRLDAPLPAGRIEAAARRAVARHEILRTSLHVPAEMRVPLQFIDEQGGLSFQHLRLEGAREQDLDRVFNALCAPDGGAPLRVALVDVAADDQRLMLSLPATHTDARGLDNVAGLLLGGEQGAHAATAQYADLAQWQWDLLSEDGARPGREYWREAIGAAARAARPPLVGRGAAAWAQAPAVSSAHAAPRSLVAAVDACADALGVDDATVCLASWLALWQSLVGETQVTLGVSYNGRRYDELDALPGLFARVLPVVWSEDPGQSFARWVERLHAIDEDNAEWQECFDSAGETERDGLDEVQYDSHFGYHRVREVGRIRLPRRGRRSTPAEPFALALECERQGGALDLRVLVDPRRVQPGFAGLLLERYLAMLQLLARDPRAAVSAARRAVSPSRPSVGADASAAPPLIGVFEQFLRAAAREPAAPAVACGDTALSYADLERRVGATKRRLLDAGVQRGDRVVIYLDRSPDLIAAILGTLAAGAAYVPVDPAHPGVRAAAVAADAGARAVLTQARLRRGLADCDAAIVTLDEEPVAAPPERLRGTDTGMEDAAYVLYTSGSTGAPKGVVVTHANLCHSLRARMEFYGEAPRRMLLVPSVAFDSSVAAIFWALCHGGTLVVASAAQAGDPRALAGLIRRQRVTHTLCLPSIHQLMLELAGPGTLDGLEQVVVAGERCPAELVRLHHAALPGAGLCNEYGPTEATVWCTAQRIAAGFDDADVPIGRPVPYTSAYVVDARGMLLPPGVPGELCIGGGGVARGYLGQASATARRFVPDPFGGRPGGRMYRTGDRVFEDADGVLRFVGRIDDQIKIRGHRVEPVEVESALNAHPRVREAVVVCIEPNVDEADGAPGLQLVAGYCAASVDEPASDELRRHLEQRLPAYMVPVRYVCLEQMPRTANGKLDRAQARARLSAAHGAQRAPGEPPRGPVEQAVADAWKKVLGEQSVARSDNFFALGGDSILAIRVASRLQSAGYRVNPVQLFEQQTVAGLAAVVRRVVDEQPPERADADCDLALMPAQQAFLGADPPAPSHRNMAVLLGVDAACDDAVLQRAWLALEQCHDALRLRFAPAGGTWTQRLAEPHRIDVASVDLRGRTAVDADTAMARAADQAHEALDIERGPLARAVRFRRDDGDRLLLIVHHLIVDAVSWHVLLDDLRAACAQIRAGTPPRLPAPPASWAQWTRAARAHARSAAARASADYWLSRMQVAFAALPGHGDRGRARVADAEVLRWHADQSLTAAVLDAATPARGTQVLELLTSALAMELAQWSGGARLLIEMEGHGRDHPAIALDLSRTPGWFSNLYPLPLELPASRTPADVLEAVSGQMRAVPNRGIDFGLLLHLGDDPELRARLAELPQPEVCFNYLGQVDRGAPPASELDPVPGPVGALRATANPLDRPITVDAAVRNGRLETAWTFDRRRFNRQEIARLAEGLGRRLAVLAACRRDAPVAPRFDDARLTPDELRELLPALGDVVDLYPLTPLQQGLLFHCLKAPHADVYLTQVCWSLDGALDAETLHAAWTAVVDRHPTLRTSFHWRGLGVPHQTVHRAAPVHLEQHDWRAATSEQQQRRMREFLGADRRRGFDLDRAPLMRLSLIRLGDDQYHLVWSAHHLVLDGWSARTVQREAWAEYGAMRQGERAAVTAPRPYADYVRWLSAQPRRAAERFWRGLLGDVTSPTPFGLAPARSGGDGVERAMHRTKLSTEHSSAVEEWSRRRRLTASTLFHAAWGLLLMQRTGRRDVIFGATSAGRPSQLDGVESMVGLFINTLPVRVAAEAHSPLDSWLQALQARLAELRRYEYSSLSEIRRLTGIRGDMPLFETIVLFENFPAVSGAAAGREVAGLAIEPVPMVARNNFAATLRVIPGTEYFVDVLYDAGRFSRDAVSELSCDFLDIVRRIVEGHYDDVGALLAHVAGASTRRARESERSLDQFGLNRLRERAAARSRHFK